MMPVPKSYLHDKLILLLLSANIFLAFLCIILIFLRLDIGQAGQGYIVQYRSNVGFKNGGVGQIASFAVFALIVLVANAVLSIRTYQVRRGLSVAILSSGILLLIMAIIVSNALLSLH